MGSLLHAVEHNRMNITKTGKSNFAVIFRRFFLIVCFSIALPLLRLEVIAYTDVCVQKMTCAVVFAVTIPLRHNIPGNSGPE